MAAAPGDDTERKAPDVRHRFIAEVVAIFIYVLLGAGVESLTRVAAVRAHHPLGSMDWLLAGFAHGFALFLAIVTTRWISGAHANPAITLGLAITHRFPRKSAPLQLAAQFLGAILGAFCVLVVFGRLAATVGHLGAAELTPNTSLAQAFVIEALGTGILTLSIIATSDPRAPATWGALTAGMSVLVITLYLGPSTSALVNPARAFGPDLVDILAGVPVNWSVFLIADLLGPLIGGAITCVLYVRLSGLLAVTR